MGFGMATRAERKSKVKTLAEAAAMVNDGDRLAIGGFVVYQRPMAFLGELVRQGRKDLTVVGVTNSLDVDLLAGAGALRRVETSYVGLEKHGLAPNFRRAVEAGELQVVDYPEILSMERFRASQENWPFWPCYYLGGNDVALRNPDIKALDCPASGRPMFAVPPAAADVTVIHAIMGDRYGNVLVPARRLTPQSLDITLARSCDRVIVTVEKIVDNSVLQKYPHMVEIPAYRTAAIVEAPFGAHPTAMASMYEEDEAQMHRYAEAAADPERFEGYLDDYVRNCASHEAYLEKIGIARLMAIRCIEVAL